MFPPSYYRTLGYVFTLCSTRILQFQNVSLFCLITLSFHLHVAQTIDENVFVPLCFRAVNTGKFTFSRDMSRK